MKAVVLALLLGGSAFTFADPAITEASGLVDLGSLTAVVNDSGSAGIVYVVDGRGRTVGRTTFAEEPWDTEALAPGRPGHVRVADIGDNIGTRASVRIWDVPIGRGDRTGGTSYSVRYPDGPHDAESLLRWRGDLYVVTKSLGGGGIYRVPEGGGTMTRVGSVQTYATDAAAYPGSSVALVRSLARAVAVRLPSGREIDDLDLPPQRQGEAISIGPGGRIRVTSEGRHQDVLEVETPRWLENAVRWSDLAEAAYDGVDLIP